jgi:hypothetical protein
MQEVVFNVDQKLCTTGNIVTTTYQAGNRYRPEPEARPPPGRQKARCGKKKEYSKRGGGIDFGLSKYF